MHASGTSSRPIASRLALLFCPDDAGRSQSAFGEVQQAVARCPIERDPTDLGEAEIFTSRGDTLERNDLVRGIRCLSQPVIERSLASPTSNTSMFGQSPREGFR